MQECACTRWKLFLTWIRLLGSDEMTSASDSWYYDLGHFVASLGALSLSQRQHQRPSFSSTSAHNFMEGNGHYQGVGSGLVDCSCYAWILPAASRWLNCWSLARWPSYKPHQTCSLAPCFSINLRAARRLKNLIEKCFHFQMYFQFALLPDCSTNRHHQGHLEHLWMCLKLKAAVDICSFGSDCQWLKLSWAGYPWDLPCFASRPLAVLQWNCSVYFWISNSSYRFGPDHFAW